MGRTTKGCCCGITPPADCADAHGALGDVLHANFTCAECAFLNQTVTLTWGLSQFGDFGWNGCMTMAPCDDSTDPQTNSTYGHINIYVSLLCCGGGPVTCAGGGVSSPGVLALPWALRIRELGCAQATDLSVCGISADHDPCGLGKYFCGNTCDNGATFIPPAYTEGFHSPDGSVSCGGCQNPQAFDCLNASYSPLHLPFKWIFQDSLYAKSKWGTCTFQGFSDGFWHYCCPNGGFGTGEFDVIVTE